jgi:phosphohistidine phosphatase SixA
MERLGEELKAFINGSLPVILSSTANRTKESAEILGSKFGVVPELHEVLGTEDKSDPDDDKGVLDLIKSCVDKSDCIILMTHQEYTDRFPTYFSEKFLATDKKWPPVLEIEKGEAIVIDCEKKTYSFVR